MKPRLAAALLAAILGSAATGTAKAEMKIQSGVFYDVGKACYVDIPGAPLDNEYCWAAAGSNVLQYWLQAYGQEKPSTKIPQYGISDYKGVSGGVAYLDIYKHILEKNHANDAAYAHDLFNWYFNGRDLYGQNALVLTGSDGGFYAGQGISSRAYPINNAGDLSLVLGNNLFIKGTAVTLQIEIRNEQGVFMVGHNMACWGYDENADNLVTSIIISDSDDQYFGALKLDVVYDATGRPSLLTDNMLNHLGWTCYEGYSMDLVLADYITTPSCTVSENPACTLGPNNTATTATRLHSIQKVQGGITVGDGNNVVVLTGEKDSKLEITAVRQPNTQTGLDVKPGALVSLQNLSIENFGNHGIVTNGNVHVTNGSFTAKGNKTAGNGGAVLNNTYLELSGNESVVFENNRANGLGGAIYNFGTEDNMGSVSIRGNKFVRFASNFADKGGNDIYVGLYGYVNIVDNDCVVFEGNGEGYAITNTGMMFLGAKKNQQLEFRNTGIDCTDGFVYIGRDVINRCRDLDGAVSFTSGDVRTQVSALKQDAAAYVSLSTINANGVTGTGAGALVRNGHFITNSAFEFKQVALQDVSLSFVGAGAVLNGVSGRAANLGNSLSNSVLRDAVVNIYGTDLSASNISNVGNLNFIVDSAVKNGSTMLTLTDGTATNLSGTTVRVDVSKAQLNGQAATITLLHNDGGQLQGKLSSIAVDSKSGRVLNSISTTLSGNSTLVFGSAITADTNTAALVSVSGNDLILTLGGEARPMLKTVAAKSVPARMSVTDETDGSMSPNATGDDSLPVVATEQEEQPVTVVKEAWNQSPTSVEETETVSLIFRLEDPVAQAANKAAVENLLKSIAETRAAAAATVNRTADFMLSTAVNQAKAAASGKHGVAVFSAVGGSNLRYNTGSSVQGNGFNLAAGVAKAFDGLTLGVAGEYATTDFRSHAGDISAQGENALYGGALLLDWQGKGGWHMEGAVRMGRVSSEYNGLLNTKDDAAYQGVTIGAGKSVTLSDSTAMDLYARYMFSYTAGSMAKGEGAGLRYDSVSSHRSVLGARVNHQLSDKATVYAGAAWMHEYAGDAAVSIDGIKSPSPSLEGSSGMLEVGTILAPFGSERVLLNLNLSGWTGVQRGISGGAGISVSF